MRMSCNGCRVLRKGCSEKCSIRPCLQWIKSPEAQANATVFLAKFYGRAGLMNLINAGPDHLRPAIFRSLLYEACGRIVNPIYGSVGLLWSGSWQLCQSAVEAVLKGAPIVQISSETAAAAGAALPLKAYDIRHVAKGGGGADPAASAAGLHKVAKASRTRFKRSSSAGGKPCPASPPPPPEPAEFRREQSHDSAASHHLAAASPSGDGGKESESEFSGETGEASHVSQADPLNPSSALEEEDHLEVGLELTLGFEPLARAPAPAPARPTAADAVCSWNATKACGMDLGLQLSA